MNLCTTIDGDAPKKSYTLCLVRSLQPNLIGAVQSKRGY